MTVLKKRAGVEVYDAKLDNLLPKPSKKVREGIEKAQLILSPSSRPSAGPPVGIAWTLVPGSESGD